MPLGKENPTSLFHLSRWSLESRLYDINEKHYKAKLTVYEILNSLQNITQIKLVFHRKYVNYILSTSWSCYYISVDITGKNSDKFRV